MLKNLYGLFFRHQIQFLNSISIFYPFFGHSYPIRFIIEKLKSELLKQILSKLLNAIADQRLKRLCQTSDGPLPWHALSP